MDRINLFAGVLSAALVLGFAGFASAQEEETTEQVDWEEAAEYAELMDTWFNDDGIEMNTYYDDAQNVLWSQPADVSVEAGANELAEDPEKAALLDITVWVHPISLWLCDRDKGVDANCVEGTNYKWNSSGDFYLEDTVGNYAFYVVEYTPCEMDSIERVRSHGSSSSTNYCTSEGSDYDGYVYNDDEVMIYAENEEGNTEEWCNSVFGIYYYYVDISDELSDEDYHEYNGGDNIARFRYKSGGSYYYTYVEFSACVQ